MIDDLVGRVRGALGVSSSYDADLIPDGIRRACRFILRGWDFPQANARWDSAAFAIGADSIDLPAFFEKPWAAKLMLNQGADTLSRDLPRGGPDAIPHAGYGPRSYSIIGRKLYLDTKLLEAGYYVRLWYKSLDLNAHEEWLTGDYEDTVFVRSVFTLANELSKPEIMQAYGPLWQEQVEQLGTTVSENNYADSEVIMRASTRDYTPRYGGYDAIG